MISIVISRSYPTVRPGATWRHPFEIHEEIVMNSGGQPQKLDNPEVRAVSFQANSRNRGIEELDDNPEHVQWPRKHLCRVRKLGPVLEFDPQAYGLELRRMDVEQSCQNIGRPWSDAVAAVSRGTGSLDLSIIVRSLALHEHCESFRRSRRVQGLGQRTVRRGSCRRCVANEEGD